MFKPTANRQPPTAKLILITFSIFLGYNLAFAQQSPPPLGGQTLVDCVSNLQITEFGSHNKKHKVVICGPNISEPKDQEQINYKAKTTNIIPGTFDWKVGEDAGNKGFVNYWGLLPLPPDITFNRQGNAYIP